ncbi:MAG: GTP-binding protein [Erysipelotrichia bacterium]|nr:GTP-binding protein [Erysipelotrichia bacterium]
MKILVVSGFLGAGKTTFIKELAKQTKKDFVVMENEYGETGIDKEILENEEINIWELTEGCICCSMKSDFASSILTIANTLDPEYLVVEPTGVGVLSNVINNIKQIEYERITLLKPITIIDYHCFDTYMQKYHDIYIDQLKSAATIVISKGDVLELSDTNKIESELHAMNPDAHIQIEHYSKQDKDWWQSLLLSEQDKEIKQQETATIEMENMGLENIRFPTPIHLLYFLEELIHGQYGQICRAKGFAEINNEWFRFDVVNDRYSITGFDEKETAKAIFIGNHLQRSALRKRLLNIQTTKTVYPSFQLNLNK